MNPIIASFFCFLWLFAANFLLSQTARPGGLLLSTTGTYRFDPDENLDGRFDYQDLTWGLHAVVFVSKSVRVGAASWQVFAKDGAEAWRQYFMAGPVVQYELPVARSIYMAGELGAGYGDFYPQTYSSLARRRGTYFGNLGLDLEWYWHRNFMATFGWRYFPVLSKIPDKDNFAIYTVGVGYLMGKK